MASRTPSRPISPHLGIYRWGPHMLVSILHRATGDGMATLGSLLLVWWLAAIAAGGEAYATFLDVFTLSDGRLNVVGWVFGIGLTWALFQHMCSGIRHLVLDTGANYELKGNRLSARLAMAGGALLTALFWFYIIGVK
ncbi:succinate dehydrogenase / fumarate reductase cytochrome b subunit [Sphingomonas jinjuensis]|uniref:Succinate dehydrogenase cytochrome b556 subunit n=2 Tax=Sphingomonas jinjuensis TaxID=535907 RepID=A0A840FAF6_9SPHN|nr:succinate dehydrogenase, cytochrome b556 subunit [Sphingomonas jinjuensis]MBB4155010.1 succinate dehydrogenase / fumarate reductase cytochrome b subunit [Sphingomonas jinjuensis]